ncbi:sodium/potassium-transporting ATPase subunit beta-1-interacting protein 2-like [Anneissia japonica]|uniref:sodium/potassium-transporting ATPase subunit beta-1-interacting protein 2-like n=1 Tax=Anneissia japonica TaxID=1529436 RepID=UPI0014257B0E|nr:sodium/potassium-transporting ATPase subunit beta-1-interacting protein 2-like [Anneissia japonica]
MDSLASTEKLVFDFVGYMWTPIIGDFLSIIFTLFGLFGCYQYRPKFLAVAKGLKDNTSGLEIRTSNLLFECFFITNNHLPFQYEFHGVLPICGELRTEFEATLAYTNYRVELWLGCSPSNSMVLSSNPENSNILNFNTGSESWWKTHGFGCTLHENNTVTSFDDYTSTAPEVTDCLLDYIYIETIHAAVQILLAVLGFILAIVVIYKFNEEEDSFDFIGGFDSYSAYNPAANVKGQSLQMQPIYMPKPDEISTKFGLELHSLRLSDTTE